MKLIAIERVEGGLVVHKPDGARAIVQDDAAQLGKVVLEIVDDSAQPSARVEAKTGSVGGDPDMRPQPGESADQYVNRIGVDLGIRGATGIWRTLQRMSGTKVEGR